MSEKVYDVAVVGGGAVGLAFAAALKREAGVRLKVALIDAATGGGDGRLRTVALSPGSRTLLDRLGAWEALRPQTQPILEMAIYDGTLADAVRLEQMRFAHPGGEPLAHMAYNDDVTAALRAAALAAGVEPHCRRRGRLCRGAIRRRADASAGGAEVRARLVVAADGARSKLRGLADIATTGWPTRQSGIVATIGHERDHEGRAEQHFLPAGPFAMLPLQGRFSSLVWNEPPEEAERLCAAPEAEFIAALERRFSPKLGALRLVGRARAFPLEFRFARRYVADRLALIGDAAHLVHPLAGQGLNLGLRDVAALAEAAISQAAARPRSRGARTARRISAPPPFRRADLGPRHGRAEPAVLQRKRGAALAARPRPARRRPRRAAEAPADRRGGGRRRGRAEIAARAGVVGD